MWAQGNKTFRMYIKFRQKMFFLEEKTIKHKSSVIFFKNNQNKNAKSAQIARLDPSNHHLKVSGKRVIQLCRSQKTIQ